jgi:hypothetical protein
LATIDKGDRVVVVGYSYGDIHLDGKKGIVIWRSQSSGNPVVRMDELINTHPSNTWDIPDKFLKKEDVAHG